VLDSLAEMLGPIVMRLGGQCGVQWWRKTSYVLDCHNVRVARFQELIQHCKYLRVEHLEATDAIHHPFQSLSLKTKCYRDKGKKVKVTLVQALRLCTGHTAHRGSRGIALLFHDHGTRRGRGVSVTTRPLFTSGKDRVVIVQEARWAPGLVWRDAENLAPTGT